MEAGVAGFLYQLINVYEIPMQRWPKRGSVIIPNHNMEEPCVQSFTTTSDLFNAVKPIT